VLIGLIAAIAVGAPERARAQGLFDVLRGIFGGSGPPPQRTTPPMLLDDFPRGGNRVPGDDVRVPGDGAGVYAHYCVRLCDGRYFPVPASAGAQSAQLCSAMCPAAKTEIYTGSGIERAATSRGKLYTTLATAFAYRERLVDNCTCTGKDATGLAKIEIESDPTLRPGDIVTTKDGQSVFKGDRRTPHKSSEFTPVQPEKRTSSNARRGVRETRAPQEGRAVSVPAEPTGPATTQALGFARENGSGVRRVGPLGN
jgi:hypothetical protein